MRQVPGIGTPKLDTNKRLKFKSDNYYVECSSLVSDTGGMTGGAADVARLQHSKEV